VFESFRRPRSSGRRASSGSRARSVTHPNTPSRSSCSNSPGTRRSRNGALSLGGSVSSVRVMSWNVAGRAVQLRGQLKAVLEREADVIALQEIREATYPAWREGLLAEG